MLRVVVDSRTLFEVRRSVSHGMTSSVESFSGGGLSHSVFIGATDQKFMRLFHVASQLRLHH